jgi:hypothetical protein
MPPSLGRDLDLKNDELVVEAYLGAGVPDLAEAFSRNAFMR